MGSVTAGEVHPAPKHLDTIIFPFGRMSIGKPGDGQIFIIPPWQGLGGCRKAGRGAHFAGTDGQAVCYGSLPTTGRGGFPIRHGQGQGTVFEVRVVGHLGQHLDLRREGDGLIGGGKLHLQYRFVFPKGVAVDLDGVPLGGNAQRTL